MQYNKGDEVYYITFFKQVKKCKILYTRTRRVFRSYGCFDVEIDYIIEFKNGKIKAVNANKIF